MAKPGDFFVGIIDLFAIFLPGGMLTFVTYHEYKSFFLDIASLEGGQYWLAFFFCSYFLGHIVFMVGSKLDILYSFHRVKCNPYTNESAFQNASNIKHKFISGSSVGSFNTYQWSTSILTTFYPEAMVEVNRLVADSKFFRSFVVILPFISFAFFYNSHYLQAGIFLALIIPCYLRYYERRLKSTTRAYQYIIMLHGLEKLLPPSD